MQRLLKKGDVFFIEKGQKLYTKENGMREEEVIAGKASYHQEYKKDKIVVDRREYFSKAHLVSIKHIIPPVGEYIVLHTSYSGGGCGMGPDDVYPDGWHVTAKPLDKEKPIVSFYQTGCFTAMLENPRIIK